MFCGAGRSARPRHLLPAALAGHRHHNPFAIGPRRPMAALTRTPQNSQPRWLVCAISALKTIYFGDSKGP